MGWPLSGTSVLSDSAFGALPPTHPMTRAQPTGVEGEFVEAYLPIGEYGPYPERLRQ
ncbi:hypothetical protein ACIQNU_32020 [Streptomyces sp. NPDC091292]|uniref:hypothetical protein n=1 Tax=Streptomyces sp. NPDC091292 TaxID=3365991 RepID=UPI0038302199